MEPSTQLRGSQPSEGTLELEFERFEGSRFMEVFEKKDLSQVMAVAQTHSGIIIVDGDPDIFLDEMFKMFPEELYCKVFFKEERLYDPRENILVPRHRLATEEEIKALEDRHIPLSSLPRLSRRDIIARWEGWKKDDIIAIERSSDSPTGIELYFRVIF
jgi:DNA-directed RNA polymerase subunit H (RpoH/RPB5)